MTGFVNFVTEFFPVVLKKTLVIGASTNPERFSYLAVRKLKYLNYPVCAIGLRAGEINGVPILKPFPELDGIHTVTLYVGPANLVSYMDYILALNPKRVIFNPGTEHDEFRKKLEEHDIEVVEGCTLVMLSNGQF